MTKFLIIRFSSIGDIIQCMGIIGGIRERFADVEIHWITRKDMVGTLSMDGRRTIANADMLIVVIGSPR